MMRFRRGRAPHAPFRFSGSFAGTFVSAAGPLLLGIAGGCNSEPEPVPVDPKVTLRVALVHPGREDDRGWNQLAYEALQTLPSHGKTAVKHVFAPNASNFKSELRGLAEQNYELVICHGGEYAKSARAVAPQFPKTHFVVVGSDESGDGVAALDIRLWEATYLCGVLAAKMVPDGPAGLIGAQDVRTVRYTLEAFANGARSVKPDYPVQTQYVGSWDDAARATQTARSLIDGHKVRILFQNCDAGAFGVFQAAKDAKVFTFGCNSDQSAAAPKQVLASAIIDMDEAFSRLVDSIRAGRYEAKVIKLDLKSGCVRLMPNSRMMKKWPKGADEELDDIRLKIINGKLDVLKPPGKS